MNKRFKSSINTLSRSKDRYQVQYDAIFKNKINNNLTNIDTKYSELKDKIQESYKCELNSLNLNIEEPLAESKVISN